MDGTWWVDPKQLDEDQIKVIDAPLDESHLVLGPPGSGKSNLLLLRANYIELAGHPDLKIIIFTRELRDFMRSGSDHYSFHHSKIQTSRSWAYELLREHDITPDLPEDFDTSRRLLCQELKSLLRDKRLGKIYPYILLDEVQDYLPEEIDIFLALSHHLIAVGDDKQKIYSGSEGLSHLKKHIGKVYYLQHHYRNGLKICHLADGIAEHTEDYISMASTSNYNETAMPSSVEVYKFNNHDDLLSMLLDNIELQMKAYPNEYIGVLTPRHRELKKLSDFLRDTKLYKDGKIRFQDDSYSGIYEDYPIIVSTIHNAKGLEFRALNLCYLERVFMKKRNMCFTGVTRAKTSLRVYHIGNLPSYFEEAYAVLNGPLSLPSVEDCFHKEER